MKVKEIELGMTYDLGDNDKEQLFIRFELEEHDSVNKIYANGQKLLAKLISNGNPGVYHDCLEKLSYSVDSDEHKEMFRKLPENCEKIKELRGDFYNSQAWLANLKKAKNINENLKQLLEIYSCWKKFNDF